MSDKQPVSPHHKNIKTRKNTCVDTCATCSCDGELDRSAVERVASQLDVLPLVAEGETQGDGGDELTAEVE